MFYLTSNTYKKLKEKTLYLEAKIREASTEIAEANEEEGWHDSFAFEQAEQKKMFYETQLYDLKNKLNNTEIIKPNLDTKQVGLGHKVGLISNDGLEKNYTIVGEMDSDLPNGLISFTSPIGQKLVGKKLGENVDENWKITFLEPANLE